MSREHPLLLTLSYDYSFMTEKIANKATSCRKTNKNDAKLSHQTLRLKTESICENSSRLVEVFTSKMVIFSVLFK